MNQSRHRLVLSLTLFLVLPLLAFTVLRTPPRPVVQVSPPPDSTGVWLGSTIQVTFDAPMDHASVESRFVVNPPLPGAFVWSAADPGETVEFRPDDILAASRNYTVTLQAGMHDVKGGVVLSAAYAWSFTTQEARPAVNFGWGLPVQLVDPGGRNRVRVWPGYPRMRLDFVLYALPTAEFVARYGRLDPSGGRPIDVSGLTRVAGWQQTFRDDEAPANPEAVLPAVAPGIYVLVASRADAGADEMIVVVSPYVLALKGGADEHVVAWAVHLQSQTPAGGMRVTLYDAQGTAVAEGTTGDDGVVELQPGGGEPRLAVGQVSGDETSSSGSSVQAAQVTVAGLDGAWRTDGVYWYWYWEGWGYGQVDPYRVYLYTDRPIYRPGDSVHFAAILRRDVDGTYTPVDASLPVTATLRDSRNNVVATQALTPDSFGSVSGAFTLAAEPPMGTYQVELSVGGTTHQQALQVEAYRKPEYKVDVTAPVSYAVAGDTVQVSVASDYFFGQPVAGAEVVLKVFRRSEWYWWQPSGGEQVAELRGTTGSDGRWTTGFTTDEKLGRDAVYTFAATVTDASRQPVEGQLGLPVHWNTFRLALTTDKYGYQPGEAITAHIDAHQHDASPVAGLPVTIAVWRDYPESEVVARYQATTGAQGQAAVALDGLRQGWYRLTAGAEDARGRPVESTRYLWIYERSGVGWWYSSADELSIKADRDRYAPGDTARLLIESRVTGVALLTLQRGSVYEERVVRIDGPATTVDVPIGDEFAPNVFAWIHLFKPGPVETYGYYSTREGRLMTAQVELLVSAESHRLSVSLTPDAPKYRPGDRATFTIEVTDASGRPVEGQVGLALVDEAIFSLSEDLSADIFDTFYGQRPDTVAGFDSLAPRRYYWSPYREVVGGTPTRTPAPTGTPSPSQPPEAAPGGQGVRQEFRDTAYWNPSILTGPDGQAVVTVDLPDNLTTWRAVARAVTRQTHVGDATTDILVTQEIIARPALPRFTVLGDRFAVDAVVQNFSGQSVTGTATLDAPRLEILDPGPRSLALPNVGTGVARWSAVAAQVGAGRITYTLDTTAGSDAVALSLSTKPFAVPERWSAAGQANPVAVEQFDLPFNAVRDASGAELRLSPSVALGVLDGLDALIGYPYGCVEQTMSRVLPSAVAARAYRELDIPNPKADELPEIIHQGVQRLNGFQHEDGSWGWWYDDEGSVYMTAYVLFGLTMVGQAGFEVEPRVMESGFTFLDSRLPSVDDPRVAAYALYVKSVAGRGDLAAARDLLPAQESLDPFARAALALTLAIEGDLPAAQSLVDRLIAEAAETPTTAYWPMQDGDWSAYYWKTISSDEKNTAMAVRALAALRPDHPLVQKAVRWLMSHRQGAGWRDTQATAFAVLGLVDVVQVSGELQADYGYTVTLNGQTIAAGQVTSQTVTQPIAPIAIAGADLRDGSNALRVERDGPGQLYYTLLLRLELFYDGFEPVNSIDQGLTISRTYRLLEGTRAAGGSFSVGDLVEVELVVEARGEAWYVIVEDPLPAGFEALNERTNPVAYGDWNAPMRWYEWGYNRKDIYDDRVVFFATQLWRGQRTFTYLMRATTPGEFGALPAQAYPMYAEEVWGRSASHRLSIAPEALAARPALAGDFDRNCRVTDFDTRQVAGAWGTANRLRDVNDDGIVDLVDVATVGARRGATCQADQAPPGSGDGRVELKVIPEAAAPIPPGQTFDVDVSLADASRPGGFGLVLSYDPAGLRVAGVKLDPALTNALPLGPRVDGEAGRVAFGVFGLPTGGVGSQHLATITFVGQRPGDAGLRVEEVQAVDGQGRTVPAEATLQGGVTVGRAVLWFPFVSRSEGN